LLLQHMGYRLLVDSDLGVVHHRSESGRISPKDWWKAYACDSAFLFGALSGGIKIKLFPGFTLLSRVMDLAGVPALVYDYMKGSASMSNSSTPLAQKYTMMISAFFHPDLRVRLNEGVAYQRERPCFCNEDVLNHVAHISRHKDRS
jgi:hypothetical protein